MLLIKIDENGVNPMWVFLPLMLIGRVGGCFRWIFALEVYLRPFGNVFCKSQVNVSRRASYWLGKMVDNPTCGGKYKSDRANAPLQIWPADFE